MDSIDIVMATYNGEKFISEQINSLLLQTHKNWHLIISDDGSTDRTVDIIKGYVKSDERVSIVNTERQGGILANFSKALSFVTAPYVMFSDQDDIWLADKISSMLDALKEVESSRGKDIPVLGFSDLCLVDEAGGIIHKSFYKYNGLDPENNLDYRYLSWRSTVYGCTVIFNKALLDRAMPLPIDVPMHDQWFALIAALFGEVFFVPESRIYYRQHGNNAVGGAGKGVVGKIISMKQLYLSTRKAALKCICQWNHLATGRWGELKTLPLGTLKERLRFILESVLPYRLERKLYSLFFSIAILRK